MVWSDEAWSDKARSDGCTEQEIVRLIHTEPQQGFTLLLQQFGGRIRGYLSQRFPSLDDADSQDVVTDAMLALAGSYDSDRGSLPAWFLLLAHQKAVALLRSRKSLHVIRADGGLEEEHAGAESDPLAALESQERMQELFRAIRGLPGLERSVVEADVAAGRSVIARKLADQLGTSEGSIYAARRRARIKLMTQFAWLKGWLQTGDEENGSTTEF